MFNVYLTVITPAIPKIYYKKFKLW